MDTTREESLRLLTKLGGNIQPMLVLMKTGKYRLTAEQTELENRKLYRENTGKRNPRHNVTSMLGTTTEKENYHVYVCRVRGVRRHVTYARQRDERWPRTFMRRVYDMDTHQLISEDQDLQSLSNADYIVQFL